MTVDEKKTQLGMPNAAGPGASGDASSGRAAAAAAAQAAVHSYLPGVAVDDPLLGQTLVGKYYVEKKLGEGGMGAVYLCQHVLLEKAVALKVLHGEFARKPELVQRFMQEARAASKIRHENVIDISDFGATSDGIVFFAMELLSGHDLHHEVGRAKVDGTYLPWDRSLSIFLQVCSALAAAHKQGIVHRDLKPENIYVVERNGRNDWVKLLDFGIAKLTELGEGEKKLTRTGMLFGTPEYMAPEQARGEQIDHRVDVYAMGCILHQLVTSRVPFESDNYMGVLTQHLTSPPPPVSPAALAGSGAPPAIAGVIAKALAKDRDQRYSTIVELAQAVRAAAGLAPEDEHGTMFHSSTGMTGVGGGPSGGYHGARPATAVEPRGGEGRVGQKSKLPLVVAVAVALIAVAAIAFMALSPEAPQDAAVGPALPPTPAAAADVAPVATQPPPVVAPSVAPDAALAPISDAAPSTVPDATPVAVPPSTPKKPPGKPNKPKPTPASDDGLIELKQAPLTDSPPASAP
ncbi:MAG: serine/threonine protein kinase [Myxococcales bacterium]|nr:serine/threonine protein kinase [Myxococcales bacterium]